MKPSRDLVLRVAVPVPLPQLFDYLPPPGTEITAIARGIRVRVPFGRGYRIGIVIAVAAPEIPVSRLKTIAAVLDRQPLLTSELLSTLEWTARYYQHPLGEAIDTALPMGLRSARPLPPAGEAALALAANGAQATARSGTASARLLDMLRGGPVLFSALDAQWPEWRRAAANLRRRSLVETIRIKPAPPPRTRLTSPPLTTEQERAIAAIAAEAGRFAPFLLEGITGSGKTEVYLALAERALARDEQVLVLVPEIGLTPQLLRRFRERLPSTVHALHSDLADGERTRAWLAAARGESCVILGTRSAVFVPLPRAGLIVVDEEHDTSFKQQDGLRYHARDLALLRGKSLRVPVVLGSATPSLESLANVESGRYRQLHLSSRPGTARSPPVRTIDLRGKHLAEGLAPELVAGIRACLARGEQALLFRNRRGYAPVLLCRACGWHAACARCDKPLTWHRGAARLRCHHCGAQQPVPVACPQCGQADLAPQGLGTERMEQALSGLFPGAPVVRIDRETVRRKGTVDDLLNRLAPDRPGIYVGTQMLAKGHDLPNLTFVGLIGVDSGLFSVDFRASERLCQLIVQVAGRAGRALKPGEVWLQTHHPDHPLLRGLLGAGYAQVARELLAERREAGLPPYAHLALLRAEAKTQTATDEFLAVAAQAMAPPESVSLLGPMPAPMPRRAGSHRGQLLLSAANRKALHAFLPDWLVHLRELREARRVRWSIDVDPVDLY
ncbi:MAG: primosomal protein N' [Xanthomonadaceae bacterium]|nr:primosomal protein N' [Xanthomonadaceae bacterium]MDE2084959.1 primosomal protein N' [Xanthomonadaceae bacterium]